MISQLDIKIEGKCLRDAFYPKTLSFFGINDDVNT